VTRRDQTGSDPDSLSFRACGVAYRSMPAIMFTSPRRWQQHFREATALLTGAPGLRQAQPRDEIEQGLVDLESMGPGNGVGTTGDADVMASLSRGCGGAKDRIACAHPPR
jgi:hypothetical protein